MQQVHIASKSYRPGQEASFVVLVGGKYYKVGKIALKFLCEGHSPEWCGLEPYTNEDDDNG